MNIICAGYFTSEIIRSLQLIAITATVLRAVVAVKHSRVMNAILAIRKRLQVANYHLNMSTRRTVIS